MKKIILIILFSVYANAQDLWWFYDNDYQPETLAFQMRIINNGGTISAPTLKAVDDFVKDVATIRTKLLRVNLICGDGLTATQIPLFFNTNMSSTAEGKTKDSLISFVGADYSEANGLRCATTPKHIQTGLNPSTTATLGLNDVHIGIYIANNVAITQPVMGNANTLIYARYTDNKTYYRVNVSGDVTSSASTDSRGFWVISRLLNTTSIAYRNATQLTSNASNSVAEANTQFIVGGSLVSNGSNTLLRGYTIGTGLTPAEITLLNTAIEKFNDALGRGVQ